MTSLLRTWSSYESLGVARRISSVRVERVDCRRFRWASRFERRVVAVVCSFWRETVGEEEEMMVVVESGGREELRYAVGEKESERKGCRAGSERRSSAISCNRNWCLGSSYELGISICIYIT